jgi:hypothetical protein
MAWVSVLASLSAGTQSSAPAWVRARAVAINLVAVQASLALGRALWGTIAMVAGTRVALATSAGLMVVLLLLARRVRVKMGSEADVTAGAQLPDLVIPVEPLPDDGPVLIQIEYQIAPEHRDVFLRAIHAVEPSQRRNDAASWRIFRDLGEDGRCIERFIITLWAECVRLRARITVADRLLQDRGAELQRADTPVRISRFLGVKPGDASTLPLV